MMSRNYLWITMGALYLIFLGLYSALVMSVNTQEVLMGEEVSVSIRDVLFFQQRLQHNPIATNWGGHALYALASCLTGESLFYGRFVKAAVMALLPTVVFLFVIHSLRCRPATGILAALSTGLLPGITAFSWVATEYGLTLNIMLLALLLANSGTTWKRVAASGLVALGALVYPPGLAALPVVLAFSVRDMRRDRWRQEALVLLRSLVVVALIFCIPRLWWTNDAALLTGGGRLEPSQGIARLAALCGELFKDPSSYYYFAQDPPLGHPAWAVFCCVGFVVGIARHRSRTWPLAALLLISTALYMLSGGVPGIRRALVAVVALHLFGILLLDHIYTHLAMRSSPRALRLAKVVPVLLVIYFTALFIDYRANLNALCGHIRLRIDFAFPVNMDTRMPQQLDRFYTAAGNSDWQPPTGVERDRTYALLLWQAHARNDAERIRRFERQLFDR